VTRSCAIPQLDHRVRYFVRLLVFLVRTALEVIGVAGGTIRGERWRRIRNLLRVRPVTIRAAQPRPMIGEKRR
jgi:hypothetical protein